jgi:CheY-like chemotaxis protein
MENPSDLEFGAVPQIILIVEDEALVRVDAAQSLRQGGYRVHEAANASEAMDSFQSEVAVDLLFTDVNLGKGMNGIELALRALAILPKDPGDDWRHIKKCVAAGSRNDIGEAVRS